MSRKASVAPGSDTGRADRRRLLRALTASGAALSSAQLLPDRWQRPIVESVLLPAHAQTTGGAGDAETGGPADDDPGNSPPTFSERTEFTSPGRDSFTVPEGVSVVRIEVRGAGGGNGSSNFSGGDGGFASGLLDFAGLEVLGVFVGGGGGRGFSGGGAGGTGGGGDGGDSSPGTGRGGGGGGSGMTVPGGTSTDGGGAPGGIFGEDGADGSVIIEW